MLRRLAPHEHAHAPVGPALDVGEHLPDALGARIDDDGATHHEFGMRGNVLPPRERGQPARVLVGDLHVLRGAAGSERGEKHDDNEKESASTWGPPEA